MIPRYPGLSANIMYGKSKPGFRPIFEMEMPNVSNGIVPGKGFVPFGGRNSVPSTEKMPRAGMFRPKVKSANETGKKFDYRKEDHLFPKCFSLWR